jgi:hypothetical protein
MGDGLLPYKQREIDATRAIAEERRQPGLEEILRQSRFAEKRAKENKSRERDCNLNKATCYICFPSLAMRFGRG